MPETKGERTVDARAGRPFLNTPRAAHYLGLAARHLERMRARGEGPRFRRHGRFVYYHVDDLETWSQSTGSGEGEHA